MTKKRRQIAIPFQPEVSEGELWYKAIDLIMTAHDGRGIYAAP